MYDDIFARHCDPLYASVDDIARITAWIPLPEPPKEEEE